MPAYFSPGAEATDAIEAALQRQALQRQQNLTNTLAAQREARLQESERQDLEMRKQELAWKQADRQAAEAEKKKADFLKRIQTTHIKGDYLDPDTVAEAKALGVDGDVFDPESARPQPGAAPIATGQTLGQGGAPIMSGLPQAIAPPKPPVYRFIGTPGERSKAQQKADFEKAVGMLPPDRQDMARFAQAYRAATGSEPSDALLGLKSASASAGSDYHQFLEAYASQKGTTVDKLSIPDQIQARKLFGQADDQPWHGFPPIVIQGAQGPMVTTSPDRKTAVPVTTPGADGTATNVSRPLAQGAMTAVRDADTASTIVSRLMQIKKDDWVGPGQETLAWAKAHVPGYTPDADWAEFYAKTAELKNMTIKAITGAQMSEPEARRIQQQIPLLSDKPVIWEQKAKATLDNLQQIRQDTLKLAGASPSLGGSAATPAGAGSRKVDDSTIDSIIKAAMGKKGGD